MPVDDVARVGLELGDARFEIFYTPNFGVTTMVLGRQDGDWLPMLRFDDLVDLPHYHSPAESHERNIVDPRRSGEPIELFLKLITEDLVGELDRAGFGDIARLINQAAIRANVDVIRQVMNFVLPAGFVRVEGDSLQDLDPDRSQVRARILAETFELENAARALVLEAGD